MASPARLVVATHENPPSRGLAPSAGTGGALMLALVGVGVNRIGKEELRLEAVLNVRI